MEESQLKNLVRKKLEAFTRQSRSSAPHVIMTIFGISVLPHGEEIWLGSLAKLLEPLGVNERLVRTSVFRLTKDAWLKGKKVGRRSLYSLGEDHKLEFISTEQDIFYEPESWDGRWRLVVGVSMERTSKKRQQCRKALLKSGFSPIAPHIFAHPTFSIDEIQNLLEHYDQIKNHIVLNAIDGESKPLKFLEVERILQRDTRELLEGKYQVFVSEYQDIADSLSDIDTLSAQECFLISTLAMNDYRYLLWQDRIKSNILLGEDWVGHEARQLVARIYCAMESQSHSYFCSIAENEQGVLPPIPSSYKKRFKYLLGTG
jgi:phenylacetic acid degradation operon negative regulatory protein